mmetsp:Transcript_4889/g.7638  ORF Transcript_4889/g.7638 Transcript_4889/m.7638 type:complete len:254 (-) Transcript_4889:360-1121(-)|eukprot:CAMPEP_0184332934 /NCGR_PEP_ID=MMETSP1089-20130417/2050_1 /TAXON_ID=38269 ORGANISM="Gloeochaete wittrockiana, Strain SAG46.84" /NCGR_SAMPLE_ID=MMETSP1089 /ASSEMBLY_ACC=CAM_ASM_000445 /LENGTH=253 /DNA_ID=CAMNT_0026656535 /DNA_START=51 /DNA_END=812 /DNA_ORIENTATION=-
MKEDEEVGTDEVGKAYEIENEAADVEKEQCAVNNSRLWRIVRRIGRRRAKRQSKGLTTEGAKVFRPLSATGSELPGVQPNTDCSADDYSSSSSSNDDGGLLSSEDEFILRLDRQERRRRASSVSTSSVSSMHIEDGTSFDGTSSRASFSVDDMDSDSASFRIASSRASSQGDLDHEMSGYSSHAESVGGESMAEDMDEHERDVDPHTDIPIPFSQQPGAPSNPSLTSLPLKIKRTKKAVRFQEEPEKIPESKR